ncbi:MAG: efflux RND transporter periplasmic adaptor subunit [Desulfobacterales bacterium]|nr:efflux RND transporter periplasmic adaptor subunit [Desulfobacterales bacterium]
MKRYSFARGLILVTLAVYLIGASVLAAEGKKKGAPAKKKGPPPAPVVVANVVSGESEPKAEFVGTIFYSHVCRVATESAGLITGTYYEEGETVKAGQKLVQLGVDLLDATIEGTRAGYEQVMVELARAQKDYKRMDALFREQSISEVVLDDHTFEKKGLVKKAAALKASLDRMLLVKRKKRINAPFGGIVIEKTVEKGEWTQTGGTVAVIADNTEVDILVDVPERLLSFLKKGRLLDVSFNGSKERARFINVVPRGDIATRTFSIKLRLKNTKSLIEGMEARAHIPVGEKTNGLLVPRDSVISKYGKNVVFTVSESKATMVPVKITGYTALMAGVSGKGLTEGMKVVIKGNERVRNGQRVRIME